MMNYDEFKGSMQDQIKDFLPEKYEDADVQIREVVKNNDTLLDGLTVVSSESNISPTIYLNDFFQDYENGRPVEDILQKIADIYVNSDQNINFDTSLVTDFENVKDKIVCKVVNKDANEHMLENLPHKDIEDLAVIYQITLGGDGDGIATINISDQLLDGYGINKDELHDIAVQNTEELRPATFRSMQEVIMEMMGASELAAMGIDADMEMPGGMPMYVLTNEDKMHGAAAMLYPNLMDEIAEKVGGDFFVLPSSIHELLIIPKDSGAERGELENMVQEVNATQVAPDEVLSDYVYEYDAKEHELFRSDKAEERQERKETEKVSAVSGKEEKPKEKESLKQKLPEMKAKADAINQIQDKGKELKKEAVI
ncbi:MAG: DUF5688 family protein [Lachnospiraceae bacterium]|nr:DUF5688 family protein [Lachnospiraceae bacterium]